MTEKFFALACEPRPQTSPPASRTVGSAHTVQVKVRYGDFTTLTRQITVEDPLTTVGDLYRLGCFLMALEKLVSRPLRLLGLGVAGLREPSERQLLLL